MALSDIAEGVEVIATQERRGVATVDDTDAALVDRLRPHADVLPCTAAAAATAVGAYVGGADVGTAAREAGIAPVTAAKAFHRCGIDGLHPLSPAARDVLRDWLAGRLPRSEALALTAAPEAEFALATYLETHDPHPDLAAAVEGAVTPDRAAVVEKRNALDGPVDLPDDLR